MKRYIEQFTSQKPRLQRIGPVWTCVGRGHTGSGATARQAYDAWLNSLLRSLTVTAHWWKSSSVCGEPV